MKKTPTSLPVRLDKIELGIRIKNEIGIDTYIEKIVKPECLLKPPPRLLRDLGLTRVVTKVRKYELSRERKISEKELELLRILAEGYDYNEAAKMLGRSRGTVLSRGSALRSKLDARNTTHAVAIACKRGLI